MSRQLRKFFIGQNVTQELKPLRLLFGESAIVNVDWNSLLATLGTTISSSTWTTEDSGTIGIASQTSTGGITGATISTPSTGRAIAKNTVTMANGEIYVRDYYLIIRDPQLNRFGDYGWNGGLNGL